MKKVTRSTICLISFAVAFAVQGISSTENHVSHSRRYWISYTRPLHAGGRPKYVLQIDSTGSILQGPVKVIQSRSLGGSATAIAKNENGNLILWIPGTGSRNPLEDTPIYRTVINPRTWQIGPIKKTPIKTSNTSEPLSVTHKEQNNFLTVHSDSEGELFSGKLISNRLTSSWSTSNSSIELFTETNGRAGGVSSDGGLAFVSLDTDSKDKILAQPLGPQGKPSGPRQTITNNGGNWIDATRPLAGNRRFLIYHGLLNNGLGGFLQVLQADSATKIGNRILLFKDLNEGVLTCVIDPRGAFILYAAGESIRFQALDATGHKSGTPKEILNTGGTGFIGGMDIVEE